MRNRMPIMNICEANIPLNILKLPTLPASLKLDERYKVEAFRIYDKAKTEAASAVREANRIVRA